MNSRIVDHDIDARMTLRDHRTASCHRCQVTEVDVIDIDLRLWRCGQDRRPRRISLHGGACCQNKVGASAGKFNGSQQANAVRRSGDEDYRSTRHIAALGYSCFMSTIQVVDETQLVRQYRG
nr:hypothetical protein [Xanthomonas campestris]